MRALVTGGAGFIGSHLTEALLARGDRVRVLDDLSSGRRQNLPLSHPRLEFIEGDLRDEQLLDRAVSGAEVIFHLAALTAVPESLENPEKCIELNDLGAFKVYRAASWHRVRCLVFSSSSAVYGELEPPHHENICPRPDTPYAMHKLLGEHYGLFFSRHHGLSSLYLRYFNVYGPRQLPDSPYSGVISLFMDGLKKGRPSIIYGDGRQTRDFIHVDDVVTANLLAAEHPELSGEALNIGSGRAESILDLYLLLARLAGREDLAPCFAPQRPGDIIRSGGPVDKAARLLGFTAQVGLEEGLARTWAAFTPDYGTLTSNV